VFFSPSPTNGKLASTFYLMTSGKSPTNRQSPNQRTTCIYLLPYAKWQVPTNGQLAFTIYLMTSGKSQPTDSLHLSCYFHCTPSDKFQPTNSWQYPSILFITCRMTSSNQRTTDIILFTLCQVASSNKRTTCNPHFHQKCHPSVSGQEM